MRESTIVDGICHIISCVYNSVNERKSTVYVSPINSCVYSSVNERESTIGDGIC